LLKSLLHLLTSAIGTYGDGVGTDLTVFISDEMKADWKTHREELFAFWTSGEYSKPDIFPNTKPWLYCCGSADTLPWAARHFD
jgi:hypothetical protein